VAAVILYTAENINVFFYSLSESFAYLFEQKSISLEIATLTTCTTKQAVAAINSYSLLQAKM